MISHRAVTAVCALCLALHPGSALAQSTLRRPAAFDTASVIARARPEIAAANAAWVTGFRQHDVSAIVAAYSDSAVFITTDGTSLVGRTAIARHYDTSLRRLTRVLDGGVQETGIVAVLPDRIYEWGRAWLEFAPAIPSALPLNSGGTYLTVWQRERDGHWRITRNISLK